MAKALRDPAFRAAVFREIDRSPLPERKVHLQQFLGRSGAEERSRLARLADESEEAIRRDLDGGSAIELYFPVREHRLAWNGGRNLIVATAETDADSPVAFDLMGRRHRLSNGTPPPTPVLMVSRAERSFGERPAALVGCIMDCGGGAGGGGSSTPPPPQAGLFMTQTKFSETFESWFKGSPEFEVHVLGKDGATSKLKSLQCAGEHAGGPYGFDQNGTTWTGSVMLISQSQLSQYETEQPGQNLRVFIVEDDDTACQIKVDSTRTSRLFKAIEQLYGTNTGGKDEGPFLPRVWKKASIILQLFTAVASFFNTNDDPVGNAVEDPAVAQSILPGATWVVRGEQARVTGAIKLEMR
jgi:hypothetical protein